MSAHSSAGFGRFINLSCLYKSHAIYNKPIGSFSLKFNIFPIVCGFEYFKIVIVVTSRFCTDMMRIFYPFADQSCHLHGFRYLATVFAFGKCLSEKFLSNI